MNNLKTLRSTVGLKQIEVAEALGISERTYMRWEKSEFKPPLEMQIKLAKLFGVSLTTVSGIEILAVLRDAMIQLSNEELEELLKTVKGV